MRTKRTRILAIVVAALLLAAVGLRWAGRFLVVSDPRKSDVVLVLSGDARDLRYWTAVDYVRKGFGRCLLLSASADEVYYGRTPAQLADEYVHQATPDIESRTGVCRYTGDSTFVESQHVGGCLQQMNARSVVIVTSAYHSRRARDIFSKVLPQYQWSVVGIEDPREFGTAWWRQRRWMKTTYQEWEKLVWWTAIERWRFLTQGTSPIPQPGGQPRLPMCDGSGESGSLTPPQP